MENLEQKVNNMVIYILFLLLSYINVIFIQIPRLRRYDLNLAVRNESTLYFKKMVLMLDVKCVWYFVGKTKTHSTIQRLFEILNKL